MFANVECEMPSHLSQEVLTVKDPDPVADLSRFLGEGEFDEEYLAPTEHALQEARALLRSVYTRPTAYPYPDPSFAALGDGSLSINWRNGARKAHALVPPTDAVPVRLYYREGKADGVDSPLTATALAERLAWLARG